ncbi:MAG: DUF1015 domain-containing protein [Fimbriimonadales bacterium]|nr:DUF1015 domain-containing protein [Fimbriimonadales bacterium]
MADVRAFSALRYSEKAGDLASLVAPPYDVISPTMREELGKRSPHNVVWLTLPEAEPGDRSKFIKYGRSAARLAEWKRDGVLQKDPVPGYYIYEQTFTDPLSHRTLTRSSLITLMKLEPYEKGVVLPHEQTFPSHKEDRLRLLEATRTHLECIMGLYHDSSQEVARAFSGLESREVARVRFDDGVENVLRKVDSAEAIDHIQRALRGEKIWIADGHHRYETALKYREEHKKGEGESGEDYILIALCSMQDRGLVILPTHRIVKGVSLNEAQIQTRLRTYFNVRKVANEALAQEVAALGLPDNRVFGIVMPGHTGYLLTMEEPREALRLVEEEASDLYKMLDVTILHEVILKRVLEVSDSSRLEYTRDPQEALQRVQKEPGTLAIFTNPPTVDTMRRIAEGGEKMPQKSTYFYPKLLSGLVFWSLEDFA